MKLVAIALETTASCILTSKMDNQMCSYKCSHRHIKTCYPMMYYKVKKNLVINLCNRDHCRSDATGSQHLQKIVSGINNVKTFKFISLRNFSNKLNQQYLRIKISALAIVFCEACKSQEVPHLKHCPGSKQRLWSVCSNTWWASLLMLSSLSIFSFSIPRKNKIKMRDKFVHYCHHLCWCHNNHHHAKAMWFILWSLSK